MSDMRVTPTQQSARCSAKGLQHWQEKGRHCRSCTCVNGHSNAALAVNNLPQVIRVKGLYSGDKVSREVFVLQFGRHGTNMFLNFDMYLAAFRKSKLSHPDSCEKYRFQGLAVLIV
jgi:hypothetical protein